MEQKHPPVLTVFTLGTFAVHSGDDVLSIASPRAQNLWKLFKYILTNRDHPISTNRLIEVLWPDGDCENPIKALYSLMYRLRSLLNSGEAPKQDYILFRHNSYLWNKDAPCRIDVEEFDRYAAQAAEAGRDRISRIACYQKALALYRGDYLSESTMEDWVLPWANYYKRIYSSCVNDLVKLLMDDGEYASAVRVCEQAIERDPYEEAPHEMLINCLINMGQLTKAMTQYNYISNLLYRELGVQPSERLQRLYKSIHQSTQTVQHDLRAIKQSMQEDPASGHGASLCDMEVFRQLYNLESRILERSGQAVYVAVITIATPTHMLPDSRTLNEAMILLRQVTVDSLRRGDVISQYSQSQLVLLLTTLTLEDCELALSRIRHSFNQQYQGSSVLLLSTVEPVDPAPMPAH